MFLRKGLSLSKKINRFGEGEWLEEPDQICFNHAGINCEIFRHSEGFLLGLCELPKDHPWTRQTLVKIEPDVHGHKFIIKTDDRERIGFSCDMIGDLIPSTQDRRMIVQQVMDAFQEEELIKKQNIYRNLQFVDSQCRYLAEQIVEAHEPKFKSKLAYPHEKKA